MNVALIPLIGYLALTLLLALWAQKQAKKGVGRGFIEEYFIGGRTMGGFVLAMTIIASYTSASSFVGGPGVAYKLGLGWVLLAMIQVPTTFLTLGVLGKRFAILGQAHPCRDHYGFSLRKIQKRRRGPALFRGHTAVLRRFHGGAVHRRGARVSGRDGRRHERQRGRRHILRPRR